MPTIRRQRQPSTSPPPGTPVRGAVLSRATLVWVRQGPRPTTQGQVEGIVDREVVGAVQAVAVHPTNANVVYVAAVNGGIWRTANAMAASPHWEQLTDRQESLSFGALEFDPTDATRQTLVAGTGRFSSSRRMGGALVGVLRTTDGGANWTTLDGGGSLRTLHITGVAPRGSTIVIAANNDGIRRSTDTGATWTRISGTAGTNLPAGISFDLAGDPSNPACLFTHAGASGIFRSVNTGATWTKVSNAAIDALLGGANNVKISIGTDNNVYVAIANNSRLAGLFRSGDGGGSWTSLDLPQTVEGGGVNFDLHPGRQASIHFSLAADRTDAQLVYIGGDRQPGFDEGGSPVPRWPNSLGARDYSGRLFRINAGRPRGSQVAHLTHSNTASGSAPHADSRDMACAANGHLIEVDDGGIYRRTQPQANTGDWFSMNGDLTATEFHSVAWDANCHTVIGGTQDTGTPEQRTSAATSWRSVSTGDGGVVAVDATSTPGLSTRYSSFQNLQAFRRQVFDATGALQSSTLVGLLVLGGGPALARQFYTPVELNRVTPTRMIIGGANGPYESDDQGDTLVAIAPGVPVNETGGPIAYGAAGNADMLYVSSGMRVLVRSAAHPAALTVSAAYPGTATVVGIAMMPDDPQTAFAIDAAKVFYTTNAGSAWSDITNNLMTLGGTVLRSVAYCAGLGSGSVVVGTNKGVFAAERPGFANWTRLGTGLPTVPVLRLQYSDTDRILLAGTLGRGAWTLPIPEPAIV